MTMRHSGHEAKKADTQVRRIAPTTEPLMLPRPPSTTMVRMSKERMKVKEAGWAM